MGTLLIKRIRWPVAVTGLLLVAAPCHVATEVDSLDLESGSAEIFQRGLIGEGSIGQDSTDLSAQRDSSQIRESNRVLRNLNTEKVFEGVSGCSFHMDVKEMYRFDIDDKSKEVFAWSGDVGQVAVDASGSKRPIFMESSFQGMHGLDLSDERYLTCTLETPASAMHSFVVYLAHSSGRGEGDRQLPSAFRRRAAPAARRQPSGARAVGGRFSGSGRAPAGPRAPASASLPPPLQILMDDSVMEDSVPSFALKTTASGSSPSIAVGAASSLNNITQVSLGRREFNGSVAEVIIFDRLLSPTEEQFVHDGLIKKWIERTPRTVPNMFKSFLNKTDEQVTAAVVRAANNLNENFFSTAFDFRNETDTIFNSELDSRGFAYSHFHPEWLAGIYYTKDKNLFDKAVTMMERYHWVQDDVNGGEWYFYAKAFIDGNVHKGKYSGQGNHGYLGEVLYRAFARWRDPRYLELADRTVKFWLHHKTFGKDNSKRYIFAENNAAGHGKGIVKMFKNHILDEDTYTEVTYMAPVTARMATEFGPAELLSSLYDEAPHAQNRYYRRMAHPITGLVPSTAMLNGTAFAHSGGERWARFCNDATEKAFDRFLNSQLNYPQDADADLLASLHKVAAWADEIGNEYILADYELDGSRNNPFHTYKNNRAGEGMRASIASLSAVAHGKTANMIPWVDDVWQNLGNTHRSLRGFTRSVFLLSGAVQIENDALQRQYVPNPGFEAEFGWSDEPECTLGADAARRGSRGLTCLAGRSSYPLLDTTTFQAGATYSYSAWIRSPSGASDFHIELQHEGTGADLNPLVSSPARVGSEWQLVAMSFLQPASEEILPIRVQVVCDSCSPSTPFDVDDVNIFMESLPIENRQDMLDVSVFNAPPVPTSPIYVSNIRMSYGKDKKRTKFNGRALVTIRSNQGAVPGAMVLIQWGGAISQFMSGTTDSKGRVRFGSKRVTGGGSFFIEVIDVFPPEGFVYSPQLNIENEDSIVAPAR